MSIDASSSSDETIRPNPNARSTTPAAQQKRGFFSIPPPLKRIFDKFPLVTYPENALPSRVRTATGEHVLYIFATEQDAKDGKPSFNPSCLKWQTYLKFIDLRFITVSSTNHASPSGALPFLLPAAAATEQTKAAEPMASNKLKKWLSTQDKAGKHDAQSSMQYDAYTSLLEDSIRKVWLFQLYLSPANAAVVHRLYVAPCSSHPLVQHTISYQLRKAAESELTKPSASTIISETDIMHDVEEAIEALGTLLGQDEWFFGQAQPTLFDASVFAYTHLILDENMAWADNKLGEMLERQDNLVQHQNRILEMYY